MPERIQKIIANGGYCSRRKAEELIEQGKVRVNGRVAKIGESAETSDSIIVEGTPIGAPRKLYLVLNKPMGYETTLKSTFHKPTVVSLIKERERVIPVGRLDVESHGLLLLTNDGDFAHRVMHPRYPIDKIYRVIAVGSISNRGIEGLRLGIALKDGTTYPCKVEVEERTSHRTVLRMTLHEGKNRQIRRMIEAVGSQVIDLERIRLGPITLDGLQEGQYRGLAEKEIHELKCILGITD